MEYTEQEIEMLARFENEVDGGDIAGQRFYVRKALDGWSAPWATRIRAALRLMREAREQGAAEMRERAAELVRSLCHDHPSTRAILANIRDLPLTPTASDMKSSKLARLQRELSNAGDRHDRDECDRIDAEIAAVERIDE